MMRKLMAAGLAACFVIGVLLTGCSKSEGSTGEAAVQSVAMIAGVGTTGLYDSYAGIVVSQNEVKINKDSDKTVLELLVKADDEVTAGQVLFSYDTEEIQYNIDKGKLELEQMRNALATKKEQMAQLEKEKAKASQADQLSYTIEIQALQADIMEQDYNISIKEEEQVRLEASLENADVTSPINGRVQSVSENGTDNYGNPLPYITIIETGAYRVKGTINETTAQSLMAGTAVVVRSRVDEAQTWAGVISMIDWENAVTGNDSGMYYGVASDEMTSSSKYPFYIQLDDPSGLMIGQHVYIEPDYGQEEEDDGLWLPSYYINEADSSSPWVWAASSKDKLEKRKLTLGEYNADEDKWEIVDGLTADDYIAFPDETLEAGMTVTKYDDSYFGGGDMGDMGDMGNADGLIAEGAGELLPDEGTYDEGVVDEGIVDEGVVDDGSVTGDSGTGAVYDGGAASGSDMGGAKG